jgi:hypothetical protein
MIHIKMIHIKPGPGVWGRPVLASRGFRYYRRQVGLGANWGVTRLEYCALIGRSVSRD